MTRIVLYSQLQLVSNCSSNCLQLAAFVKTRRIQLKLTLEQAAVLAGIDLARWSALEAGWIPAPGENVWWALAGTLQIKADKLFRIASVDIVRSETLLGERSVA